LRASSANAVQSATCNFRSQFYRFIYRTRSRHALCRSDHRVGPTRGVPTPRSSWKPV